MPARRKTPGGRSVALGGLFAALAIVLMLAGGIIPFSTFAAPALAGILIVPAAIEFGMRMGWTLYGAVSLLSLFVVPDREMSLIFLFLLGYYPLLKAFLERLHSKALQWAAKLAVFNASVVLVYGLLLFVFPLAAVTAEFEQAEAGFIAALLVLGNVTFVIYDIAVARMVGLYCARIRPRLMHMR